MIVLIRINKTKKINSITRFLVITIIIYVNYSILCFFWVDFSLINMSSLKDEISFWCLLRGKLAHALFNDIASL